LTLTDQECEVDSESGYDSLQTPSTCPWRPRQAQGSLLHESQHHPCACQHQSEIQFQQGQQLRQQSLCFAHVSIIFFLDFFLALVTPSQQGVSFTRYISFSLGFGRDFGIRVIRVFDIGRRETFFRRASDDQASDVEDDQNVEFNSSQRLIVSIMKSMRTRSYNLDPAVEMILQEDKMSEKKYKELIENYPWPEEYEPHVTFANDVAKLNFTTAQRARAEETESKNVDYWNY